MNQGTSLKWLQHRVIYHELLVHINMLLENSKQCRCGLSDYLHMEHHELIGQAIPVLDVYHFFIHQRLKAGVNKYNIRTLSSSGCN